MGTSGSTSIQAMELEKLEMLAKKKALERAIANGGKSEPAGGGSSSGGGRGGDGGNGSVSMRGGSGVDQAQRDKELAAEMAERVRSQQAGSDNRLKEDANRANLAEEARAKAAARALELARSVR
jgi:hypothetical protein